jgi:nicotinamide-nucleotide amidase
MHVEIVCVGSELLLSSVNTNGSYLTRQLASIGIRTSREITVGDDPKELAAALADSLKRSDLVITTGGLGPTFDDITREAAAAALGKKLVFSRDAMSSVAGYFARMNRQMPKSNEKQASIMEGASIINNELGTAPGQMIEAGGKTLILLPGPPREMKHMVEKSVLGYLKKRFETGMLRIKTLHVCGMGESLVDEKIKSIIDNERKLEGSSVDFIILASPIGVNIKIICSATDEMLLDDTLEKIKSEFYRLLGENIFGEDNQTLEGVVGELLARKKKTLAVAESCTGGLLAHKITNVSGSSMYFKQGIVAYSVDSKITALGVSSDTLAKSGAVSEDVALEMASGIRNAAGTSVGISTTGVAGPRPSSDGKPVGLVFVGLDIDGKKSAHRMEFLGTRSDIKEKAAVWSLDLLRRELLAESKQEVRSRK